MDSKIQELTDKIYNEGVERGTQEAERIVREAQARAKQIEQDAQAKASEMIQQAERNVERVRSSAESELKLYASQLVEGLRASIIDQISGAVAEANVKAAVADPEFIRGVILELVKGFDISKGVEIATTDSEQLKAYFTANAKALLESGVSIRQVAGKATSFSIAPRDGSFKVEIGEAELLELFKSIVRPQLAKQLF